MLESLKLFEKAVENFPKWMDINKRPLKSNGGKILLAYSEELGYIQDAIDDYKDSFFLINYIGKEEDILSYLYMTQIGETDDIAFDNLEVTNDSKVFINNQDTHVLYQNGYAAISKNTYDNLIENNMLMYTIGSYRYAAPLKLKHIWNIFDEFALFLSLERYVDLNETNTELAKRCLNVFRYRPNSTDIGLKNTIINAVANYSDIGYSDIDIETINENNFKANVNIYKTIADLNQDTYKFKRWDKSIWNHEFKELEYIPNEWDKPIYHYQDGVGDDKSCSIVLDTDISDTTDVDIYGYKKSNITINEYIKNNSISAIIPLTLTKYNEILKPKDISYQIIASEVKKVDIDKLTLEQYCSYSGTNVYYLDDIVNSYSSNITKVDNNIISDGIYKLVFKPNSAFTTMEIQGCNLITEHETIDLRTEQNKFIFDEDNVLHHSDVLLHVTSTSSLPIYRNIVDTKDGMTLGTESAEGYIELDINNMSRKVLKIEHSCDMSNITDSSFVSYNGFTLSKNNTLEDLTNNSGSSITIDLKCNKLSLDFMQDPDPLKAGSINVAVFKDGVIDSSVSGIKTKSQTITIDNKGDFIDTKVIITKIGMYPVTIRNIKASRYEMLLTTKRGTIIKNSMSTLLPNVTGENTLYINIKSYSQFAPVISYIHIGPSLSLSSYTIDNIDTSKYKSNSYKLDIDSNCIVELYKMTNNVYTLIEADYITKSSYKNESDYEGYIELSTGSIQDISYSSVNIDNGRIYLNPGDTLSDITITGNVFKLISKKSSYSLFSNVFQDDEVYATEYGLYKKPTEKCFIDNIKSKANHFKLKYDFKDIGVSYYTENTNIKIDNESETVSSYDGVIDHIDLTYSTDSSYISINENSIIATNTKLDIINNFSPRISLNKMFLFILKIPINDECSISFDNGRDTYLGTPKYVNVVNHGIDNTLSYDMEVTKLENKYVISNTIELTDTDDLIYAQYIITPPDEISIEYDTAYYEEEITVLDDGFNKLTFSNIKSVNITIEDKVITDYELMKEAGIIRWNDNSSYAGKKAKVCYYYNDPVYMYYNNLDYLYKLVGYTLEAYEQVDDVITLKGLTDGETRSLSFNETIDKFITRCSNYKFLAAIDNNKITVRKTNNQNSLAIHNGYYYKNGLEYYNFANRFIDLTDNFAGITMHNVIRENDVLNFIQDSTNYLPYSSMEQSKLTELCNINFITTDRITGVSKLNSLSACETYGNWIDFDMNISFIDARNNLAIMFEAQSKNAYSALDITRAIDNDSYISILGKGVDIYIGIENKVDNFSMNKSLYLSKLEQFKYDSAYNKLKTYTYNFTDDNYKSDYRHYIIVEGSGYIDDIIISDSEIDETVHIKNIDKLGFNIDEALPQNYITRLEFCNNNKLHDIEVTNDLDIKCDTSVDWGLTQIYKLDFSKCKTYNVLQRKDRFISNGNDAYVETEPILLNNKKNIQQIIIKVNDYFINDLKDFDIYLYSAAFKDSSYTCENFNNNTNVFVSNANKIGSYIKARIVMPNNRIINNLEIYVKYVEKDNETLTVLQKQSGNLITKVYDTGAIADYRLTNIEFNKNVDAIGNVNVYIRGCRENDTDYVWTSWYKQDIDFTTGNIVNAEIFKDYSLFQFKIEFLNSLPILNIKSFNLEVV